VRPKDDCFCHPDEKGVGHCHPKTKCKGLIKCDVSYKPPVVMHAPRAPTIETVPTPIMCPVDTPVCVENCCGKVCRKASEEQWGGKQKMKVKRNYFSFEARDDGEEESD
jgi:hypothetical protein